MRNALCYVLQNARRHGEWLDPLFHGIDPFSSAMWFDGWRDEGWRDGLPRRADDEPPVAAADSYSIAAGERACAQLLDMGRRVSAIVASSRGAWFSFTARS